MASEGSLVRRKRAGRTARRGGRRAGRRRAARARALWRRQPRHRAAGLRRARAGERIRTHACAVHGRRVPVSGQVRLCDRRHGRGGAGARPRPCSCCIRIRTSSSCPAAGRGDGAGRRAAAARGARRQYGDGAQCGLGRRARTGGPDRRCRRRRGRASGCAVVRPDAGHAGDRGRRGAGARRAGPGARRALRDARRRRLPIATWSSTPAPAPPASPPRCGSPARRPPSSS